MARERESGRITFRRSYRKGGQGFPDLVCEECGGTNVHEGNVKEHKVRERPVRCVDCGAVGTETWTRHGRANTITKDSPFRLADE